MVGISRFEDVLDALPAALLNVDVKDAREAELRKLLGVIDARGAVHVVGPVLPQRARTIAPIAIEADASAGVSTNRVGSGRNQGATLVHSPS